MFHWIYDFVGLLFPRICACCGNNLWSGEHIICISCSHKLPRTHYYPESDNPVAQIFWGRVRISQATAYLFFNKGNRVQKLIHQLKYKGRKDIGIYLGKIFGDELNSCGIWTRASYIIPVPLHPRKLAKRGFNQSEEIARGLSETLNIPLANNVLIRKAASSTQTRKNRFQRWKNVEQIFGITHPEIIRNKTIMLVDDVITTGATIESCTQTLLQIEGVTIQVVAIGFTAR